MPLSSKITVQSAWVGAAAALLVGCSDPYGSTGKAAAKAEANPVPEIPAVSAPAHGFGDAIGWETLESGLARSKAAGRPMMLVVHADWCPRCKELKPKFFEDDLAELSKRFVMVNLDQDKQPRALEFVPDGQYVPRVMFVDPAKGAVDTSLLNSARGRDRYFYTPNDDLLGVMKKALARHEKT